MIREIKYIWKKMSYDEMKTILKENPRIHSFPLVHCHGILFKQYKLNVNCNLINFFHLLTIEHMILLGSIQRDELVNLIERQIGPERRLKVAAERETARNFLKLKAFSNNLLSSQNFCRSQ